MLKFNCWFICALQISFAAFSGDLYGPLPKQADFHDEYGDAFHNVAQGNYDPDDYDKNGFDPYGYNRDGYDENGFDCYGLDQDGYDENGYDTSGLDRYGYRAYGKHKNGYDIDGYDEYGYDRDGYDEDGYDWDGYDEDGQNEDGFNRDGYDQDGYDIDGYDVNGYDKEGLDIDGYDAFGYNTNGYDEDGYDRDGYDEDGYNNQGFNIKGYNTRGFHWSFTSYSNENSAGRDDEISDLPFGQKDSGKKKHRLDKAFKNGQKAQKISLHAATKQIQEKDSSRKQIKMARLLTKAQRAFNAQKYAEDTVIIEEKIVQLNEAFEDTLVGPQIESPDVIDGKWVYNRVDAKDRHMPPRGKYTETKAQHRVHVKDKALQQDPMETMKNQASIGFPNHFLKPKLGQLVIVAMQKNQAHAPANQSPPCWWGFMPTSSTNY
jgi:hypothetical protein